MNPLEIGRRFFSLPLLVSLFTIGLIMLPVASLIISSFTSVRLGVNVGFTVSNYYAAYSDPRFLRTLVNSLVYAGGSTLLALSVAAAMAWVVTRTNTPLKGLAALTPLLALLMPPMMDNIAWIFLLAPRSGILNSFLAETLGIRALFSAFSLPAMMWVHGLSVVPLMYVIVLPAFSTTDRSLEEAAHLSGAGAFKTLRMVTLPLALPAILSATAVGVLNGLRSFETPTLQGIPAGIPVFVSLVYEAAELEFNYGLAVAYATILLILTLCVVWVYVRVTRTAEKYAVIAGRAIKPRIVDIGKWRFVTLAFVLSYFIVAIIVPFTVVFISSVIPTFTYEFFRKFYDHLTTYNYAAVLRYPTFLSGLANSLYIATATAFIALFGGTVMSYVAQRGKMHWRNVFETVGTLPLGFPGLIISLGLLLAYFGTPFYNSALGILLAFVIFYFPYGIRTTSGALIRIHKEMEEAARVHGASWKFAFGKIMLPLLRPALESGFFYIFIVAYREVGAAVLLTGPGVNYGAVTLFEYYRLGQWAEMAAGSIIYAALLLLIVLAAKYLLRITVRL